MASKPRKWSGSPSLKALLVPIDTLTLDPTNPRRHGQRNLDAIQASLQALGQRKPICVRKQDMVVVAGNGTVQAARGLGWTHVAALVDAWTKVDARAYSVADNRTAELAEWDRDNLVSLLSDADLKQLLGSTQFSQSEIDELMRVEIEPTLEREASEAIREDQPAAEPQAPAIAKPGDLWTLGRHQVLCASQKSRGGASWVTGQKAAAVVVTSDDRSIDEREAAYQKLLKARAPNGCTILDIDGRDGALLMACERTGLSARVLSADPHHVDLIVTRWERQTGGKAERQRATQRRGVTLSDFVYPPDMIYCGD